MLSHCSFGVPRAFFLQPFHVPSVRSDPCSRSLDPSILDTWAFCCSDGGEKRITLINPQVVNLDAYKEKLEQAIKSYERQVYSKEVFKEDGPVQYMQHKEALLEALENLGWPISYEDVILLEDEILAALTYMQQASDLQEHHRNQESLSKTSLSPLQGQQRYMKGNYDTRLVVELMSDKQG
uniref:Uncharacterized protein n=1 Tax=Pavo cristatus TaxID=9049 RepID=A0A8C9LEF7_PAVCR